MEQNPQLFNSQLPRETSTSVTREYRRRRRSWLAIVLGVGISAASAAGCAKARAATVPDGPPLAMPLPPPRVFVPVEQEEPLAAGPVAPETPPAEAPSVTPRRPPRRAATPPEEKPEPAPQPPQPAPEPQRELRAASTPADAEADKKIRALLSTASKNLGNVDYQKLSVAGREQYDQAKSFGEQAGEALTQRNYVFAETLADKAAKLATELLGR
jgi:outer membrane biosynthesis protein TonB